MEESDRDRTRTDLRASYRQWSGLSGAFGRWRDAWEAVAGAIRSRVALDEDSDTRRFQKVLVVVASFVGSIATLFNAMTLFSGGLDPVGWAYVVSASILLAGCLALLTWPGAYVFVTTVLLVDVLLITAISQVLSGGITSGLYALPWAIFAPLGAALALGGRHALAHLALFVVVVATVAVVDPYAQSVAISQSALLSFNVPSLLSLGLMAGATSLYLLRQVERFRTEAESLLHNVLPDSIATRLKAHDTAIADRFENVAVVFADIVGFTPLSSGADPEEIVTMLDSIFSDFDRLAQAHRVEKIKTIGDSYMAASGLSEPNDDHTEAAIEFALGMLTAMETRTGLDGQPIRLRIGINIGPVVAGVIGENRLIYDLWGDTVNVASRMESNGLIDTIQVTQAVKDRAPIKYSFNRRDPILIKGKGKTTTYTLSLEAVADRSRTDGA